MRQIKDNISNPKKNFLGLWVWGSGNPINTLSFSIRITITQMNSPLVHYW